MDDSLKSELVETYSIEVQNDADLGLRKKFRSIKRKKGWGRGFHGKKHWEVKREEAAGGKDITRPIVTIDSTPTRSQETQTISARKLQHSPLQMIEGTSCLQQRPRKKGIASSTVNKVPAHGFKIQDVSVLTKGLANAVTCAVCKKGKLLLLQNDKNRAGPEERSLQCTSCKHETIFSTCGKISRGAFEVNRRSVLAAQA